MAKYSFVGITPNEHTDLCMERRNRREKKRLNTTLPMLLWKSNRRVCSVFELILLVISFCLLELNSRAPL